MAGREGDCSSARPAHGAAIIRNLRTARAGAAAEDHPATAASVILRAVIHDNALSCRRGGLKIHLSSRRSQCGSAAVDNRRVSGRRIKIEVNLATPCI